MYYFRDIVNWALFVSNWCPAFFVVSYAWIYIKFVFQWYKQNRELKRKSQVLAQKFLQVNPDGVVDIDISDEVDSNSDDTEQLRETVKGKIRDSYKFWQIIWLQKK